MAEENMSEIQAAEGRRLGRPPKDESEKRIPLSLRIKYDLRSALVLAAKEENRSLTQLSEFALENFLEARKHGHAAGKDASPTAAPPSAGKQLHFLARQNQSLEDLRDIADALAFAFGSQTAALMLAIGCLTKDVIDVRAFKNQRIERTWLSNPCAVGEVSEAVTALLQLIGPDEHPALFAAIRQIKWGQPETNPVSDKQLSAACLVNDMAFNSGAERWAPVIRDRVGEAVLARIRQRFPEKEPAPDGTEAQNG
jgi:hypothetical protein